MQFQEWIVGLGEHLKKDGFCGAGGVVEEMVGNDPNELGGVGKSLTEYAQANSLDGPVEVKINVNGVDHVVRLGGGPIQQGIVLGAIITAFLAQGP